MTYRSIDILNTYTDCAECNKPCYKLIDCDTYQTVSTNNPAFNSYLGSVIKWVDEADAPNYIERCAVVEKYYCRLESYPQPVITVVDCYKDCARCLYVPPRTEEEIKAGRIVKPGYDVPDCNRPSSTSCD